MNGWMEIKEQMGRRGGAGQMPKCQDAKWQAGQAQGDPAAKHSV